VSYQVSHICYQADGVLDAIVYLGTASSNQAQYPVRLIQFWLHGRHYRYLTNVLDPQVLRLSDVVNLYARRWDIELAFRALKDHLNLHHLWSAKWAVVQV
jgi:IS4 transposase